MPVTQEPNPALFAEVSCLLAFSSFLVDLQDLLQSVPSLHDEDRHRKGYQDQASDLWDQTFACRVVAVVVATAASASQEVVVASENPFLDQVAFLLVLMVPFAEDRVDESSDQRDDLAAEVEVPSA